MPLFTMCSYPAASSEHRELFFPTFLFFLSAFRDEESQRAWGSLLEQQMVWLANIFAPRYYPTFRSNGLNGYPLKGSFIVMDKRALKKDIAKKRV